VKSIGREFLLRKVYTKNAISLSQDRMGKEGKTGKKRGRKEFTQIGLQTNCLSVIREENNRLMILRVPKQNRKIKCSLTGMVTLSEGGLKKK